MPRVCTICTHPQKTKIDKALLASEPFRKIAANTGTSISSLFRHRNKHIPLAMAKAHEAEETAYGGDLLSQAESLHTRTLRILEQAEREGDFRLVLTGVKEARSNLELLCKMFIQSGHPITKIVVGDQFTADQMAAVDEDLAFLTDEELSELESILTLGRSRRTASLLPNAQTLDIAVAAE